MGSTDCINIVLLHQGNIPDHIVIGYGIPFVWMGVMPVYALKLNLFSIHQQHSVLNFNLPETHIDRICFLNRISFVQSRC